MARKYLMSWEGKPNYRWVKMYRGARYRVTCEELQAPRTKEGSTTQANAWWEKKLAELKAPVLSPLQQAASALGSLPLEKLCALLEKGQALSRLVDELPFATPAEITPEDVSRIVGATVSDEDRAAEQLSEAISWALGKDEGSEPASPITRKLGHHAEKLLELYEDKPGTFKEIRDGIWYFFGSGLLTSDSDVAEIGEEKIQELYLWLKKTSLGQALKVKRWGFFKYLVRHLWEHNLITLPRNLNSRALRFVNEVTAVKTWPLAEVRDCLARAPARQRLYALLGLNCGMTNVDISELRKDQVDLEKGRLVRKRVKTTGHKNVPTVDYALWPEVVVLLEQFWSSSSPDQPLVLTSERGTCLLSKRLEKGPEGKQCFKAKDLVGLAWRRVRPRLTIPIKSFRSISATLLESHSVYGRYVGHFLGHSPRNMAERYYSAPSGELFDQALLWLHGQLYEVPEPQVADKEALPQQGDK